MPTGYTHSISKGILFEKFVMNCARAFGACIEMRDESSDTEIPKKFKESNYHKNKLKEIEKELKELKKITIKGAEEKAGQEHELEIKRNEETIRKNNELRNQYEDMLSKVKTWQPPTTEHNGLKDFMTQQIRDSIKWDCNNEYYLNQTLLLTGKEYISKQRQILLKDLDYHTREAINETKRIDERNKWISDLRKSLKNDKQ